MGFKKRPLSENKSEGAPEWMVTYSDLVTLLLTFFILLFSMASIDSVKFKQVTRSLQAAFINSGSGEMLDNNVGKGVVDQIEATTNYDSIVESSSNLDLEEQNKTMEELNETIQENNIEEYVKVIKDGEKLILRMDSLILFDEGSADIKQSGQNILKKLGNVLDSMDKGLMVLGHTDNRPIHTTIFPSNWELSTKRATNVVIFLVNHCGYDPKKLTAAGNGEYRPIKSNDTEENRRKNRRIDMVISK